MSAPINDGGPAFPKLGQAINFGDGWLESQSGMSLRDYFAGQALGGLLANPNYDVPFWDGDAKNAYAAADAMIAAREVKP